MPGELVAQGPFEGDDLGVIDLIRSRSERTRASNAGASSSESRSRLPATPNRSVIGTCTPSLANTACT